MITEEHIGILEDIAFNDNAKPNNRLAALTALSNTECDIDQIKTTLAEMASEPRTPDAVKVKAIVLLDKLNNTSVDKDISAVDAERIKQTLMEQYTGESRQSDDGSRKTEEPNNLQGT